MPKQITYWELVKDVLPEIRTLSTQEETAYNNALADVRTALDVPIRVDRDKVANLCFQEQQEYEKVWRRRIAGECNVLLLLKSLPYRIADKLSDHIGEILKVK